MWAVALVVQQPLKVLSQNLQTAIFSPPFLASDEFETVKYCQIGKDDLSVCLIQSSSTSTFMLSLFQAISCAKKRNVHFRK